MLQQREQQPVKGEPKLQGPGHLSDMVRQSAIKSPNPQVVPCLQRYKLHLHRTLLCLKRQTEQMQNSTRSEDMGNSNTRTMALLGDADCHCMDHSPTEH